MARTSNLVVVSGGRPAGSNLVLSSLGVDVVATHDVLFSKQPRLHQRGTAIAVLDYRTGSRFAVAGVHLSLDAAERARVRHLGELDRWTAEFAAGLPAEVPVIAAGKTSTDQPGSVGLVDAGRLSVTTSLPSRASASAHGAGEGADEDDRRGLRWTPGSASRAPVRAEAVDSDDVLVATDHLPVLAELAADTDFQ